MEPQRLSQDGNTSPALRSFRRSPLIEPVDPHRRGLLLPGAARRGNGDDDERHHTQASADGRGDGGRPGRTVRLCSRRLVGRRGSTEGGGGSDGGKGTVEARPLKPIGDGSTADTGAQPHQPTVERLKPGQRPPQFVVFSWDGAGELSNQLFSRFRKVASDHGASMTFFLSGIYTLPESKKDLYRPPRHAVGASAIGYLADRHIHATLQQVRAAWLEGTRSAPTSTVTSAVPTGCATGRRPSGGARSTRR